MNSFVTFEAFGELLLFSPLPIEYWSKNYIKIVDRKKLLNYGDKPSF